MFSAFIIFLLYSVAGFFYSPSVDSLVALCFITLSSLPLLLASGSVYRLPGLRHPPPGILFIIFFIIIGVLNLVVIANRFGFSGFEILNPIEFAVISSVSTESRYSDQGSSGNPFLLSLSLFLIYRIGTASNRINILWQALSFMPVFLYALLTTEKWPLFLSVAFYITGIFAAESETQALNRSKKLAVVVVPAGFVLGGIALCLRGFDRSTFEVPNILLHYILAPFSALGHWLVNYSIDSCCEAGKFTFIGLGNLLGLLQREAGVFSENYVIYGMETNIYTSWRYLVQDFSIYGPLLICIGISLIFITFKSVRFISGIRVLKLFLVFTALISVNVTPFVHNTTGLALALALAFTSAVSLSNGGFFTPDSHE